jgi:predicted nucleotidyltransferase component of viral defense system
MLREETVEPATLELLKKLVALPELKNYRLVGGTALSLLFGHRKSIDLDLFTDKPIDRDNLIPALEDAFGRITTINDKRNIYQCVIQNVKVDFVSVRYPFLNPVQIIDKIPFADTKDLIALKLNAVKGRGVKKDFWDVAKLLKIYTLEELVQMYLDRYTDDDNIMLMRSIGYFDDAENFLDPECLEGMSWTEVKDAIKKALNNYYKNRYK